LWRLLTWTNPNQLLTLALDISHSKKDIMLSTRQQSHSKIFDFILHLPIWLYHRRLGWLLGHSFLMITHRDRLSGRAYQTVVKTVRYEPAQGLYIVTTAWGETAEWLQNIQKTPEINLKVGGRNFTATATQLSIAEAHEVLSTYAQRHPGSFRSLAMIATGQPFRADAEGYQRLAQCLPLVVIRIAKVPYYLHLQQSR
jgi:deazaflavin-dependent oxidoreductase (nitroreductase family)